MRDILGRELDSSSPVDRTLYVNIGQLYTTLSWKATTNSNPHEYFIYEIFKYLTIYITIQ